MNKIVSGLIHSLSICREGHQTIRRPHKIKNSIQKSENRGKAHNWKSKNIDQKYGRLESPCVSIWEKESEREGGGKRTKFETKKGTGKTIYENQQVSSKLRNFSFVSRSWKGRRNCENSRISYGIE